MQTRPRLWVSATIGLVLAIGGGVLGRPVLLYGAVGIAAWVIGSQTRFLSRLQRLQATLTISQHLGREELPRESALSRHLEARVEGPLNERVAIDAADPASASSGGDIARCRLDPSTTTDHASDRLTFPVAGRHEIDPPRVTVTGPAQCWQTSHRWGEPKTVTVYAPTPSDLQIGGGTTARTTAFGGVKTGESGPGIDPAEIREYIPGDAASQIDWRATARLGEPHVREFDTEADRRIHCYLDHRRSLAVGPTGQTVIDYLREVVLGLIEAAAADEEPIGLTAIGDGGISTRMAPAATRSHYERIRSRCLDVETPTQRGITDRYTTVGPPSGRRLETLDGEDSSFARRLRPFFRAGRPYEQPIETDPFHAAVRSATTDAGGESLSVLLTGDRNRGELLETAREASARTGQTTVFLAPVSLFRADAMTDLDAVHAAYLDFRQFQQRLQQQESVQVFQVVPGERFSVLETEAKRGARL